MHFEEAGHPREASDYSARAGDQAMQVLAFDRAAALFRTGPRSGCPGLPSIRVGSVSGSAMRSPTQVAVRRQPGSTWRPPISRLRRSTSGVTRPLQYLISGHVDEGLATLRDVLDAVGMKLHRSSWKVLGSLFLNRLWLRLRGTRHDPKTCDLASPLDVTRTEVCWSASIGLSIIDPVRGAEFQTRGLLYALRSSVPHAVVRALAMEAAHVASAGARPAVARPACSRLPSRPPSGPPSPTPTAYCGWLTRSWPTFRADGRRRAISPSWPSPFSAIDAPAWRGRSTPRAHLLALGDHLPGRHRRAATALAGADEGRSGPRGYVHGRYARLVDDGHRPARGR